MTRTLLALSLGAAAALAGCNKEDHTIVAGPAVEENAVNTAGVELPPSIAASKIYRCKDNSVVYVDWLRDAAGNPAGANFRADKAATPTQLKAAAEGEPLTAEGHSLTGTAEAPTITLSRPGAPSQSCKA